MTGWMRSLRWRLMAVTVVTLAVALAVAGWSLAGLFRDYASARFDEQLQLQLDHLTAAFELDERQAPRLKSALTDPRWHKPYSGLYWQIEALAPSSGAAAPGAPGTALRSRSLWDQQLAVPDDGLAGEDIHRHRTAGPAGQSLRVLERRVQFVDSPAQGQGEPGAAPAAQSPSWRLVVAEDDSVLADAVAGFTGLLALFLAILGLALVAAAWAQVHLGLKPLRALQSAVRAMRRGDGQRLSGNFPTEVEPLVQDFNRVLDSNRQVVERARTLAGNLAHAIKTPLAVIANLADDAAMDRQTLSRQLHEQVDTALEQVDWHLRRARRSGSGVPGQRSAVSPAIEGLARVMRKLYAHREGKPELVLEVVAIDPRLDFAGEAQDLQEMVGNLLENACKWATSRVRIRAAAIEDELRIAIDDDGPGLTDAQRRAVFERGVRADERTPGSGLGLTIARETAGLYAGSVSLEPSELGGLRAELRLPAVPDRER